MRLTPWIARSASKMIDRWSQLRIVARCFSDDSAEAVVFQSTQAQPIDAAMPWTKSECIVMKLPTEDCIRGMWTCTEDWCSGHFGRWYYESRTRRRVLKTDSWLALVRFGAI